MQSREWDPSVFEAMGAQEQGQHHQQDQQEQQQEEAARMQTEASPTTEAAVHELLLNEPAREQVAGERTEAMAQAQSFPISFNDREEHRVSQRNATALSKVLMQDEQNVWDTSSNVKQVRTVL
jgi:hypothetical protein